MIYLVNLTLNVHEQHKQRRLNDSSGIVLVN